MQRQRIKLFLATLVVFGSSSLFAQGHYFLGVQRNFIPGGRSTQMGGAYTALSDDPSGIYFNPAGLAFVKRAEISASSNAHYKNSLRYREAIGEDPFIEDSTGIYPNFIGGTYQLNKRFSVGYAGMTLDTRDIVQDDYFPDIAPIESETATATTYSRTHQEKNTYVLGAASLAFRITDQFAMGLTPLYYQRTIVATNFQMVKYSDDSTRVINQQYSTLNVGGGVIPGLLWRGKTWSLGASLKLLFPVSDRTRATTDQMVSVVNDEGQRVETTIVQDDAFTTFNELNPTTYRLGFAWHPHSTIAVAADVLFHQGVDAEKNDNNGDDLHDTFNYSVGFEIKPKYVVIRGGAFTNNSMYRAPEVGKANQPVYVDHLGYCGGIGWHTKNFESSLGYIRQQGEGKAQIVGNSTQIQILDSSSESYLLSTSFYL